MPPLLLPSLLLFATLGCARDSASLAAPSVEAGSGNGSSSSSEPRAPEHAAGFDELELPGHMPALVFVPEVKPPWPLVVATHGAGGIPETECLRWQRLTEERALLLCPRGVALRRDRPSGFYYPDHRALEAEVLAGLDALEARFGDAVLPSSAIFTGFSQGAIHGAVFLPAHGARFPYLVLVEGGYEYWSPASARRFAQTGGRRVLFVCGTKTCSSRAESPRRWLESAGVEARLEYAQGSGHTPEGGVLDHTARALPWATAGDPHWPPGALSGAPIAREE